MSNNSGGSGSSSSKLTVTTPVDKQHGSNDYQKQSLISRCNELLAEDGCRSLTFYEGRHEKNHICSSKTRIYLLYVFLPSLMSVYAACALIPACINYDTSKGRVSLFSSFVALWIAGLVLLWTRTCIFLPLMSFCSELQLDNHKRLQWMIFLSYASILLTYEIYAYTLSGWAALGTFLFWLLYAVCYVVVFLERHVRPCPGYGSTSKGLDGCWNKTLVVFSGMIHIALLFCCIVFNSELRESSWRAQRVSCTGNGTCDCLAGP